MNSGIMPNFSRSSGCTSRRQLPDLAFLLATGSRRRSRSASGRCGCSMMSSRPTNAPPQMNRMLVVSTCRNSCCGCLRPPLGGTFATVPSMILSSACCTPSPETSRVMRGVVALARDLVDLVDVDDAALRLLDVVVGVLQQVDDDVLDVLADVAGLGQVGGVGDGERHVEDLAPASAPAASCRSRSGRAAGCSTSAARRRRRRPWRRCACSGCGPRPRGSSSRAPARSRTRRGWS